MKNYAWIFILCFTFNTIAQSEVLPRSKNPLCPPGSKLSTRNGDEPLCQPRWHLVEVPGYNLPAEKGCFKCVKNKHLSHDLPH